MSDSRPTATISVDVDPVDFHLAGYGHHGLPPDAAVYRVAIPRILDILARHAVRATFFVVGRDAEGQSTTLREVVAAGHEVAAHSMTHPVAFARLPLDRLSHEIAEPRRALRDVLGVDVSGFRAPNWDLDQRSVPILAAAGYRYDASGFPSLLQIAARMLLAVKSRGLDPLTRMDPRPFTMQRLPHRWRVDRDEIDEFPISVTPAIRWPVYHTVRYMIGPRRFESQVDGFVRRGEPFFYPVHAVDVLGLTEDGVDPRLGSHPGMDRPLGEKLELLNEAVALIAARFECVPYREVSITELG
jgi:hypothetical protein